MKVQDKKLSEIRPYEGNPRNNEKAIDRVAESVRQFGPRQPIVVDKDGVIIAGHTRYHAALKLGLETFPVHVAKDLTADQARLYRIVDNRSAEFSEWDFAKVRAELAEMFPAETDEVLDLTSLGLMGITVEQWPELTVPDFESLETDADKSSGVRSNLLAVGKYRIAMTDAEESAFVETVLKYTEESGTMFGFARWLLTKAGVQVREEVSNGNGEIASLV